MKKIYTLALLLSCAVAIRAQVNAYAKVSLIAGPVINVTNVDETYGSFTNGQRVIIMQMQDDVIGSNTTNTSSFGNLSSIANAGRYEVATIGIVTRVAGVVNLITLSSSLSNSYNLGANSSVQIISYPTLGAGGDYTTVAPITAVPWNGNTGGVVAFHVNGKLHLRHNISADNAGFRGGVADASSSPYGACNGSSYFNAVDPFFGNKGEGIYKNTNASFVAGRGKMINAGGGANTINSGGGGGANFTGGGTGSMGWSCSSATGGIGGQGFNGLISGDRFFLGGGGGSGEANDNSNNKGGNGGGIVIISAQEISTTGTGPALTISANGQAANNVGNDGAGGGGAGGSIALQVNTWNIVSTQPVVISSNGGAGGNVQDGGRHGGGGGGGQGAVIFANPIPAANITVLAQNGIGGRDYNGGTRAPSGQGIDNTGIFSGSFLILPVKLISFSGSKTNNIARLEWISSEEKNLAGYEVQRSLDAIKFTTIGSRSVQAGEQTHTYNLSDENMPAGTVYYRLRMTDHSAKSTYSSIVVMRSDLRTNADLSIFPNPAVSRAVLSVSSGQSGKGVIRIMNMQGLTVSSQTSMINRGDNAIVLENLNRFSGGCYNVQLTINDVVYNTRLIIQK
jgi:hypothetical protein